MRRPARLYAAKEHTPEEIAGMREVCKVRESLLLTIELNSRLETSWVDVELTSLSSPPCSRLFSARSKDSHHRRCCYSTWSYHR